MAFGSLVPGMAPMPIPAMQPNQMLKMGMQAMQQARGQQRPAGAPQAGQPLDLAAPGVAPQGLLQRLLNPQQATPPDVGAVATPGAGGPLQMQMGLLAKLFPALGGAAPPQMPQGDPTAGLGGLY